jgi:hypothetical protein
MSARAGPVFLVPAIHISWRIGQSAGWNVDFGVGGQAPILGGGARIIRHRLVECSLISFPFLSHAAGQARL